MIYSTSGLSCLLFLHVIKRLKHPDGCESGVTPRSLKKSMFVRDGIYGQCSYLNFPPMSFVALPCMLNTVLSHEEVNGGKSRVNL